MIFINIAKTSIPWGFDPCYICVSGRLLLAEPKGASRGDLTFDVLFAFKRFSKRFDGSKVEIKNDSNNN